MNKPQTITKEEESLLAMMAGDYQSGNHFIRPRSEKYKELWDEVVVARKTLTPTLRQIELLEYIHQCEDYEYYHSLLLEKRMF